MCRIECRFVRFPEFERTRSLLTDYSLTSAIRSVVSPIREQSMQLKYRLFQRAKGVFYWQEIGTTRRGTLETRDRDEALGLLHAKNESHRQPLHNLAMGKTYLSGYDPEMPKRTWKRVLDEMATHGIESTRQRCGRALASKAFNPIRDRPLISTRAEDLLTLIHSNGNTAVVPLLIAYIEAQKPERDGLYETVIAFIKSSRISKTSKTVLSGFVTRGEVRKPRPSILD